MHMMLEYWLGLIVDHKRIDFFLLLGLAFWKSVLYYGHLQSILSGLGEHAKLKSSREEKIFCPHLRAFPFPSGRELTALLTVKKNRSKASLLRGFFTLLLETKMRVASSPW